LWRRLAERRRQDLRVRFLLLEAALERGEEAQARRWLGEGQRLEGGAGPLSAYGEAACQVSQARRHDTGVPGEARRRRGEAKAVRPPWPRVPRLEAEMYELEGRREQAQEKPREAVELDGALALASRALSRRLPGQNQDPDAAAPPPGPPEGRPPSPDV